MVPSASFAAAFFILLSASVFADPAPPPAGNAPYLTVRARGQQLYACNSTSKSWRMDVAWADLFHTGDKNYTRRIGMHYYLQFPDANGGRPSWLISRSPQNPDFVAPAFTVTGKVIEETPTTAQLDALLLQVTSFSGATPASYIQRVPVSGGLSPSADLCTKSGDTARINYESDYVFFTQLKNPTPVFNKTSNGSILLGSYFAEGQYSYRYTNSSWVVNGAFAYLSSLPGREVVGNHYFRPLPDASGGLQTWVIFSPGHSVVTAKIMESVSKDSSSLPMLRMEKTSSSGQTQEVAGATRIERLSTRGGLPPRTPGKDGERFRSPFTAIYWFYT